MCSIRFNCSLMECAKEMIRESLPIKCLEAVVLAMYPFRIICLPTYASRQLLKTDFFGYSSYVACISIDIDVRLKTF